MSAADCAFPAVYQGQTADQRYQDRRQAAELLLDQIRDRLAAHAQRQEHDSGNWGHTGDLGYVVEQLDSIRRFLG